MAVADFDGSEASDVILRSSTSLAILKRQLPKLKDNIASLIDSTDKLQSLAKE